jgi:hypothetical protein
MVKYLLVVRGGEDFIIPVDGIINVSQDSTTTVLTYSILAHDNATTPTFVQVTLTTATLTTDEQTAQKSAVIEAIAEALSTAWTRPLYTLALPSALTSDPAFGSGGL